MKKDFVIEMEEECITCPMLSLETANSFYADEAIYKVHQCEHLAFCQKVRKNWEKYHNVERKEK